jgi:hypothetical protein
MLSTLEELGTGVGLKGVQKISHSQPQLAASSKKRPFYVR